MKKLLIEGNFDSWYGTGITSYNIVTEEEWKQLQSLKGFSFWVHEWSGKHSEQEVEVDGMFSIVTDDQIKISVIEQTLGTYFGNMDLVDCVLERWAEREEEDEEDEY